MTEDGREEALLGTSASAGGSGTARPLVPTTRGPDHNVEGPRQPPKRPPSRGKGRQLSTPRIPSSHQHQQSLEDGKDADTAPHDRTEQEVAHGFGGKSIASAGEETASDNHPKEDSQSRASIAASSRHTAPLLSECEDQVNNSEKGDNRVEASGDACPIASDNQPPPVEDEKQDHAAWLDDGSAPIHREEGPLLSATSFKEDDQPVSHYEVFGGGGYTPSSGAAPSAAEKPRAPVDPRPWRTNAKPIKPARSNSRQKRRGASRDISAVTQAAMETYATPGDQRPAPTTSLGVLLEEITQCSDIASQYHTFNELQRVMRQNEHNMERSRMHDKLEERRGMLLNMELFRLRDEHIRKWRTDLTGAILVFEYKEEEDVSPAEKNAIAPTITLGEELRSNAVIDTGSSTSKNGRSKRTNSSSKKQSRQAGASSTYTEAQWEEERLNVLDEMKIWKMKSNELRHHVNRGTNIKNLHGLQAVSAHDPFHRSSRTVTMSAPDPTGTDCLAELRLDLSKQYALCREAERQLDAAQGMKEKNKVIQQQRQHVAKEEERNAKEALLNMLQRLEDSVAEKESVLAAVNNNNPGRVGYVRQIKKAKDTIRRGRELLESLSS